MCVRGVDVCDIPARDQAITTDENMSVFGSVDDRILLEEIVETTEEPDADICSGETIDEISVASNVTVSETVEVQEQPIQQQQSQRRHSNSLRDSSLNHNGGRIASRVPMEQEKRMRREIANSNERRRMQSINAGFQSLRTLLPHHEGEKLSKAAILQQTAEYIYQLEQEKTQLLSQNCQLKRLINQQDGGAEVPIKKRKGESQGVVVNLPVHVSESGDEGLGSMSPEPLSVITVSADGHSVVNSEVVELRRQLERERHARLLVEKQMRSMQSQLYPERYRDNQLIAYQPHEVIEHTDNLMAQETEEAVASLQVVSVVSLPPVGSTQTIETTIANSESGSPPMSPQTEIITEDIKEESVSPPASPKIVAFAPFVNQEDALPVTESSIVAETISVAINESFSPSRVPYVNGGSFSTSPTRPFSPTSEPTQRLPSVLEAAMKAEPKVEVERLPSPSNSLEDGTPQSRLYLANTSRQNLETIVEAIRHLEGDHLFSDEPAQDVPLALTNKPVIGTKQRLIPADVNNFLQFKQQQQQQQQTQQRPGVIVVKHS